VQARQVLHSGPFAATFRAAVKHCASIAAERVAQGVLAGTKPAQQSAATPDAPAAQQQTQPRCPDTASASLAMAQAVPAIAAVPAELLAEGSQVGAGLVAQEEVQAFLLDVYTQGPFLDGGAGD
jgi:hypothetical protein